MVDEDDTTSTGSPTSGSSSAGTTSSVAGTGGGSTSGVTSGTGGSSTSGAGAGGSDPTGVGGSDPTGGGDATLVGVETPGADCPAPNMPAFSELKAYDKLHDPFTMMDGTKVTTRESSVTSAKNTDN